MNTSNLANAIKYAGLCTAAFEAGQKTARAHVENGFGYEGDPKTWDDDMNLDFYHMELDDNIDDGTIEFDKSELESSFFEGIYSCARGEDE